MSQHPLSESASKTSNIPSFANDVDLNDPIETLGIMSVLTNLVSTDIPTNYGLDTRGESMQNLQMELGRQLQRNNHLTIRVAEMNDAIGTHARCGICHRIMAYPYWLPYCEHTACYSCLKKDFIEELRRRALICDLILRRLCCINDQSPAFELARLAGSVERYSHRLSYPCRVCGIRSSDPPIPLRALSDIVCPLNSEFASEDVSTDRGAFDMFFPSRHP